MSQDFRTVITGAITIWCEKNDVIFSKACCWVTIDSSDNLTIQVSPDHHHLSVSFADAMRTASIAYHSQGKRISALIGYTSHEQG
ncbi:MAG: hypothetical protein COA69_09590 [Robiginitomaculum sp.]|nr:MAG: hypothetical protein COA69_09590 [Robiginitomaculum sp.]